MKNFYFINFSIYIFIILLFNNINYLKKISNLLIFIFFIFYLSTFISNYATIL